MFKSFFSQPFNYLKITPKNFGWGYGYGFFSNYRACLQQLITNKKGLNLTPYIDWRDTTWVEGVDPMNSKKTPANQENPFDYWFDQAIPQPSDRVKLSKEKIDASIIDHSMHYFNDPRLTLQKEVDNEYIKPKQFITDKINKIYKMHFEGETVLGVMARGSEYNKHHPFYGVFGIDEYIAEVKRIMKSNPSITKIYVVSEDTAYIQRFASEFSNCFYLENVFRRTDETDEYVNKYHHWCNISKKRTSHTKLLGEEVIIQTKLLGMCDYVTGRNSGILCGAVLWGTNIKDVIIINKNAHSHHLIEKGD